VQSKAVQSGSFLVSSFFFKSSFLGLIVFLETAVHLPIFTADFSSGFFGVYSLVELDPGLFT